MARVPTPPPQGITIRANGCTICDMAKVFGSMPEARAMKV